MLIITISMQCPDYFQYGELLEQNGGGDTAKWNEEVKIFNKELSACKRRKVQKSDDF